MNEKIAFFDFCETLADFQTADAFVDYVRESTKKRRMILEEKVLRLLVQMRVIAILDMLFRGKSVNKRLKLYQLKGFSHAELNEHAKHYYEDRIKPHLIKPLIDQLNHLKAGGYIIGLVSGGYGIYLRFFVDEFGLDFCVSSNIAFKHGKCTGLMEGLDCLNENKISLLSQRYDRSPIQSIAFSDSQSDLPLLKWVKRGVVVSRGKHQKWVDNHNLEEIIWE